MNIYIWEGDGVLSDYTDGMIVAVAHSLEEAYRVINEENGIACYWHEGEEPVFNFPKEPTKVVPVATAKPFAVTCWGGG